MLKLTKSFGIIGALALFLGLSINTFAQGRGNNDRGMPNKNTPQSNQGKHDDDYGRNGRYDDDDRYDKNDSRWTGWNDNRRNKNARFSREFIQLSQKIGMSPERLSFWYEREKSMNRNLTFGQFAAANMIDKQFNGPRYSNLTAQKILVELRKGRSLGQAVKRLGLKGRDYRTAQNIINGDFHGRDNDRRGYYDKDYDYRVNW